MSDQEWRGTEGFASEDYEWEEAPDLTSICEEELKQRLRELAEGERAISCRRRVIQGRIDLTRAELVRRWGSTRLPEELACVLLGGEEPFDEGSGSSSGGDV